MDEELDAETQSITRGYPVEARAQESRDKEGPADGEPDPDSRIAGDRVADAPFDLDDVNARSDLARVLTLEAFPASRDEIVRFARDRGAPGPIVAMIESAPARNYDTLGQLWDALPDRSD